MSLGAADHVRDQGRQGGTGHTGHDRSTAASRVSRYGRWVGLISENIQYGRGSPGDVVADLLIDDGVLDRGHRRNALDPSIHVAGVACGPHATYGHMCVIVHAADFSERSSSSGGPSGAAQARACRRPCGARAASRGSVWARFGLSSDIAELLNSSAGER
jgi:hypothetical protein